jgi:hypothetical protein
MLGCHLVALSLTIRGRENLECPLARITSRLARSLLNGSDEGGIKSEALLCEGHQRNVGRRIRRRREHPRGGPGSFTTWLLAIEEDDAEPHGGQLERNRGADQPAADDGHIERVHGSMLAAIGSLWRSGRDVRFILLGFGREASSAVCRQIPSKGINQLD